ncbi:MULTISPECIES: hypothetical protein [unclassified Rhizobium]|uniref:hypothetical protein n=1 Tax=unclassified Rhizobium TaxID=2613769 RepID=UPI001ADB62F9|nr:MULTISPECIES: hypothetical protein [unclassified Rhizobium]MBO9122157.1 hypothetical protein [Rhizobium sp. 16-488-2b]MBO9172773.1 hypothetical protein [Rhizobium sp. 16-488-2a]
MVERIERPWSEGAQAPQEPMAGRTKRKSPTSVRILRMLIAALLLAFAVWIPVEIWSRYHLPQPDEPTHAEPAPAQGGGGQSGSEAPTPAGRASAPKTNAQ